jgi:hypothetical protein
MEEILKIIKNYKMENEVREFVYKKATEKKDLIEGAQVFFNKKKAPQLKTNQSRIYLTKAEDDLIDDNTFYTMILIKQKEVII